MRIPAILLVVFFVAGCGNSPVTRSEASPVSTNPMVTHEPENVSVDSVQQFLVSAAATDFHLHGGSPVIRFRDVRFRYLESATGKKTYILCGEFLPEQQGGTAEWTAFVTIKTDPYEQWIGDQAATYCRGSLPVSDKVDDLTSSLQSRFDSLR